MKINKQIKDTILRWFVMVVSLAVGIRMLKFRFDFLMVFDKEFFEDVIIAGLCGLVIELILNYKRINKH